MACEQNEDWVVNEPMQSFEENPEYAPLNTIPDWVSEKVTPKEYELWRTMSSRYEINYSFLKERANLNFHQKKGKKKSMIASTTSVKE